VHNFQLLLNVLERAFGSCYRLKNNETAFLCPKCNHHKRKLQINLLSGRSHCWVCNFSAHTIPQLLQKTNASSELIREAYQITGQRSSYKTDKEKTEWNVSLPEEFQPLWKKSNDIIYKHGLAYLKSRNINMQDIFRYGIGYCSDGIYKNRIIIPSYDKNGKLNYFIARDIFPNSKMKYKNPPISKNVVIFELLINWKQPLIITEGVFDAIAIKRNAIPLLGKFPSKELIKRIVEEKAKQIYIALDLDARKDAFKLSEFFMQFDITTYIVNIRDKDPSELGFHNFWKLTTQLDSTSFSDIIRGKLYG
tara:strand:+ start:809 stop:1729 length:921 start_codon:yes stop_codon:yes gene_type:complete